jgi:DNA-binding transcriptional ArsR family regulator
MSTLHWYSGTAYDYFISLQALHHATDFGLRPNWTAGVRQRLATPQRETLERLYSFATTPLDWISNQPGSKDAVPILKAAGRLSPADCLRYLTLPLETPIPASELLAGIAKRRTVTAEEKGYLGRTITTRGKMIKPVGLENLLAIWMNLEKSAEEILKAWQDYYELFFKDEEPRIRPALQAGLSKAKELALTLNPSELVEKLSRGVNFEGVSSAQEIFLVPSYWLMPFVIPTSPTEGRMQIVFSCRSEVQSVAPVSETPDPIINALKSLADPTRLRILRYLADKPCTPTELAQRLRLRPPTVLHHLQMLRLAELVAIRINEQGEKRYTARIETIQVIFTTIKEFIIKQE